MRQLRGTPGVSTGSGWTRSDVARLLTHIEAEDPLVERQLSALSLSGDDSWIVGVTGPPGVGKSTLIDALLSHLRRLDERVAVLAVDPSSPHTGGAVLGDRIRMMRHVGDDGVFIRSFASRGQIGGLAAAVPMALRALAAAGYKWIFIETVGIGQAAADIALYADTVVLLVAPQGGDAIQASKAGVNEIADVFVVNKADQFGAKQAAREVTAAVRLAPAESRSWRPPVLLARADIAEGIVDVYAAISQHRQNSMQTGRVMSRRQQHRLNEWRARSRSILITEFERFLFSKAGPHLERDVGSGRLSPAEAASLLVQQFRRCADENSTCAVE